MYGAKKWRISIHSPYTGRDKWKLKHRVLWEDFNPLSLYRERRRHMILRLKCSSHFNPLSLYRERLCPLCISCDQVRFQSTLPIQGETDYRQNVILRDFHFNPLSLYRERHPWVDDPTKELDFNPLSLYRERQNKDKAVPELRYFNPLSLYRERLCEFAKQHAYSRISIHSPYTGRDFVRLIDRHFFSIISIHSPYTGRDMRPPYFCFERGYFNPLSLYRERPCLSVKIILLSVFQSTLPIQGETFYEHPSKSRWHIFQSTLPIQGETAILHIKLLIYSQSLMQNAKQKNFFQHLHNKL